MFHPRRIKLVFSLALAVILLCTLIPFWVSHLTTRTQEELDASIHKIDLLVNFLSELKDVETGQRGFIITGREEFLLPYYKGRENLKQISPELWTQLVGSAEERESANRLQQLMRLRMESIDEVILVRKDEGFSSAQKIISEAKGKAYMDQIREEVNKVTRTEQARRQELNLLLSSRLRNAAQIQAGITALSLVLLLAAMSYLLRVIRQSHALTAAHLETSAKLRESAELMEFRSKRVALLGQLTRALQAEIDMEEALTLVNRFFGELLPQTSGAIYLLNNSKTLLETKKQWGTPRQVDPVIHPNACWALRQGMPHLIDASARIPCQHHDETCDKARFCLPLLAQGEVFGMVSIELETSPDEARRGGKDIELFANVVAERVSLAFASIRLRETLKEQSIKDPLTGLFNRRFMEESLTLEMARSLRLTTKLSAIVLDIDHFKKFNDSYGHEAGDAVIKSVAAEIGKVIRESDVPCRFGGEEFVIVLPDCGKDEGAEVAGRIAERLRNMQVFANGEQLRKVTASIGVASFPEDGESPKDLLHAADQAMYAGKKNGRDQVVIAGRDVSVVAAEA